jgi:hypothetical protein
MGRIETGLVFSLLAAQTAIAEPRFKGWTGPKPSKPPCECRYRGGKASIGETICRMRNGRMVTLRCELVLNNTSWTKTQDGCDTAKATLPYSAGSPAPL